MNAMNRTRDIRHVFTFQFERNFDAPFHIGLTKVYFQASCYCTFLYLIFLYLGQLYMKNRPAYDLRKALVVWNSFLAVLSVWGTLRVLPELLYTLEHHGFRGSICLVTLDDLDPVSSCWYYVFGMSKFLELGDSVFLVLRKKKLIFLHWLHHSSVLVFVFFLSHDRAHLCRWFGIMNYAVHSLMYGYFAARAAQIKVPRWFAMFITCAQISQMLAGCFLTVCALIYRMNGQDSCPGMSSNAVSAALAVYAFYFSLFLNFFFQSYYGSRSKTEHIKKH